MAKKKPKVLTGVERIAKERKRQLEKLGWTREHDDGHDDSELAMAAACYAAPERIYVQQDFAAGCSFVDPFPWEVHADARPHDGNVVKPERAPKAQRIRLLEKAGALIAAELDRLTDVPVADNMGDTEGADRG